MTKNTVGANGIRPVRQRFTFITQKLTNGEYHAIGVNALADWECHAIGVNAMVNLGTPFDRGLIPWRTGSMPLTPTGFFVVQKTNDRSLFDRFDGHNSQCMGG